MSRSADWLISLWRRSSSSMLTSTSSTPLEGSTGSGDSEGSDRSIWAGPFSVAVRHSWRVVQSRCRLAPHCLRMTMTSRVQHTHPILEYALLWTPRSTWQPCCHRLSKSQPWGTPSVRFGTCHMEAVRTKNVAVSQCIIRLLFWNQHSFVLAPGCS